jgi:hypothetical protein
MASRPRTEKRRIILQLLLIFFSLACWNTTHVQAQAEVDAKAEAQAASTQVEDFTPGQYVTIDRAEESHPMGFEKSATVFMQGVGDGQTFGPLPAEMPRPSRLIGVFVPQVPRGRYLVWYEVNGAKLAERVISVTPKLKAPSITRGTEHSPVTVEIQVAGATVLPPRRDAASRQLPLITEISLTTITPDLADLSDGQARSVQTADGKARFIVDLKKCRRDGKFAKSDFIAKAEGFEDLRLSVACPPEGPIPVVFVPGTAGSQLYREIVNPLNIYWIARELFSPELLPKGALADDGTDPLDKRLVPGQTLDEVRVKLDSIESTLARLGYVPSRVPCYYEPPDVNCQEKTSKCSCKALTIPIYKNFLAFASHSLVDDSQQRAAKARSSCYFCDASYDWRKAMYGDTQERLDQKVEMALSNAPGHEKVILVAHSLGGLVSRDYIAGRGRDKVAALVAVATPWLGAPKTTRALLWGYDFGVGFTGKAAGKITIREPYSPHRTKDAQSIKTDNVSAISLLNLEQARSLSRNWPAVFIQFPTKDFMTLYGEASGSQEEGKSIVWNWTPKDTLEFAAGKKSISVKNREGMEEKLTGNSKLFAEALDWRAKHLFRMDDYGVRHYLIAGYTHPKAAPSEYMDMQMSPPDARPELNLRGKLSGIMGGTSRALLSGFARTLLDISLYRDRYLGIERGNIWGDGTAPLLSATAGAQSKSTDCPQLETARQFLGESTEVQTVELEREYGHGSMLDDPKVRRRIWNIIKQENEAIHANLNPAVYSIILELKRKIEKKTKYFELELGGYWLNELSTEEFNNSVESRLKLISWVETRNEMRAIFSPKVKISDTETRQLRMNDLKAMRLSIKRPTETDRDPIGQLRITHVRLLVNGIEVFNKDFSAQSNGILLTPKSHTSDPLPLFAFDESDVGCRQ